MLRLSDPGQNPGKHESRRTHMHLAAQLYNGEELHKATTDNNPPVLGI
jgi:hypothetical protein